MIVIPHLLQNLGETLERVFHGHSKDLKEVDEAYSQIEVIQTDGTVVAPVPCYTRRLRSSQGLKLRQRLVNKPLPIVAEPQKKSKTCNAVAD
ncbi:hypothetical protein GNF10_35320 [Nostoc sp. UCD121]|uniref:hypothetical protein n=1 Tax=unclassified Nostoc TaxID=2593658 RepID=UPI001624F86E|nr:MULTISPECIES: hypothetical protein [unclassified Nostoc]MBC1225427.1 hypothetical protein [Nostoc sp. UCD120]MBC1281057.1 hypothetical protein [Nostoc sp. UCD121]MBC1300033.1 hypothetical protein [Nostoc sp. UCD122]